MQTAKLGRPVSIAPRHTNCLDRSTAWPSTRGVMPPKASSRRPVAVTMMSAASTRPDFSRMPSGTNVSMWSVTTSAFPFRIVRYRSASGMAHSRWSHGS